MDDSIMAQQALESAKSAHKRLDSLEHEVSDLRALTVAVGQMGERLDGVRNDVTEIKADVKAINDRPRSLLDKAAGAVITAICSGLLGALLALILK